MLKCAILTISDTRSISSDASGDTLERLLTEFGSEIESRAIVTDSRSDIRDALIELCGRPGVNLVITTGGTGLSPRDNTPEATREVLDREATGIAEAMRRETSARAPMAILSRATAGTRAGVLIVNLPGSPKGVEECFDILKPVLRHAVAQARGVSDHA